MPQGATAADHETQVQALARYAARARFEDLSAESRRQLPVHILDSLGCCIAALGAGPVNACRDQVREFGGGQGATLIGGGQANAVYAAFWHTALVRYVDFMDNFLAPTETCHTADNFGVALTAAELAGCSGRDLMLGVAVGYTVQSRLVDHGDFMTRGFDHTAQLAFSHNAAAGRLLGMPEAQIANAIAMAASSDASFGVIRAKPLSQWKGLASAQSALGAMNTLFLARRGVQGPLRVVEGPFGIDHLLGMRLVVDWDHEGYEGVTTSTIKKYNAQIHTQSAVYAMIELVAANTPRLDVAAGFDPGTIASIEAEVPQITYDFTGGGLYGLETSVRTKEQADHDLRYLLAVAFLDHQVMPAQFTADRITRPDVQSLMTKVSARPNAAYTAVYPRQMPAKITIRLTDGTTFSHQVQDYPGMPSRPFTWDDVVGKFDQLVAGRIDTGLATEIKDAVRSLENIQVKELMALLARVRAD
jgi:2-methylcitrate dehydratase